MLGLGRLCWVGRSGNTLWNNPTNLTDPTGFVAAGAASSSQQRQCSESTGCKVNPDGSLSYFGYDDDGDWVQTGSSNEQGGSTSREDRAIPTKKPDVAPTLTWGDVYEFGKGRLEGIVDGAVDSLTGIGSLLGDMFTLQSDPRSQIAMAQRMDTLSSAYYTFGPAMQDMARRHIVAFRQGKPRESGYIQGNVEGPKVLGAAAGAIGVMRTSYSFSSGSLRHVLRRHSPHVGPPKQMPYAEMKVSKQKGTLFDKSWSNGDIKSALLEIANNPLNKVPAREGFAGNVFEGVAKRGDISHKIRVITDYSDPAIGGTGLGVITSGYPIK